ASLLAFSAHPYTLPLSLHDALPIYVYLAPHFQIRGKSVSGKHQRNAADGTHVFRHVVAHRPVAPRHGTYQTSRFVHERYGRSVELELACEFRIAGLLRHPVEKLFQFFERIGIGKGHHRITVPYRLETVGPVAAYPLGGRIGVVELRMGLFELLKLAHHPVELPRSEEHTSELQSRFDIVCRLLLEKKNN